MSGIFHLYYNWYAYSVAFLDLVSFIPQYQKNGCELAKAPQGHDPHLQRVGQTLMSVQKSKSFLEVHRGLMPKMETEELLCDVG